MSSTTNPNHVVHQPQTTNRTQGLPTGNRFPAAVAALGTAAPSPSQTNQD